MHDCFLFQQLLNHCFDDIEKFVGRLQQAAESYKELERRRRARDNRKGGRKGQGGKTSKSYSDNENNDTIP